MLQHMTKAITDRSRPEVNARQMCGHVVCIVLLHLVTQSLKIPNTLTHHLTSNLPHHVRARVHSL